MSLLGVENKVATVSSRFRDLNRTEAFRVHAIPFLILAYSTHNHTPHIIGDATAPRLPIDEHRQRLQIQLGHAYICVLVYSVLPGISSQLNFDYVVRSTCIICSYVKLLYCAVLYSNPQTLLTLDPSLHSALKPDRLRPPNIFYFSTFSAIM